MTFFRFALVLGLLLPASWQTAEAVSISPKTLEFESRLDEPARLKLDVDLEGKSVSKVDIRVDGFFCDRRVSSLGDGKYHIEIAPETLIAGPVRGTIQVLVDGNPIGPPVSVSGQVTPWISVRPSKLFLGAIGHGEQFDAEKNWKITLTSDVAPFDITYVELPEIADATWHTEPPQGVPAPSKTLVLTFRPNAMAAGFPFGALARKFAIIKTTLPEAALISLPLTGMLSVNTTGRDYSTYLYKGVLRWQGRWATPNMAAAFLSMALLLLCGLGAAVHRTFGNFTEGRKGNKEKAGSIKKEGGLNRDGRVPELIKPKRLPFLPSLSSVKTLKWITTLLFFSAMGVGCFYLAKTYSRGGWVAMAAGLAVLLVGIRKPRFYPIVLAGLFALAIAINPAGLSRAASTGEVEADKSIGNRLLLWKGALQMMAEHPWRGVGKEKFGDVFARDYQHPTHTQTYSTAINDFLTLGTERGIPVLAFVTSLLLALAAAGFLTGLTRGNPLLTGCAACIVCALVISWFSSIAFLTDSSLLLMAATAGVLALLAWYAASACWKSRGNSASLSPAKEPPRYLPRVTPLRLLAVWFVLFVLVAGISLAAGQIALRSRPTVAPVEIAGVSGLQVRPRWGEPMGTIIYLGDRGEKPADLLKSTLRPLAEHGWNVLSFDGSDFASDTCGKMSAVLEYLKATGQLKTMWGLAGHRQGAKLALALGSIHTPRAVAGYLTPKTPGFDTGFPNLLTSNSRPAVLLSAQEADPLRSALNLTDFEKFARLSTAPFAQAIHPGDFFTENSKWQLWILALHKFFADSAPALASSTGRANAPSGMSAFTSNVSTRDSDSDTCSHRGA